MQVDATTTKFYDGNIYIMQRGNDYTDISVDFITLDIEYDKPISLKYIELKYPKVFKVLHESWLDGELFNFNNYGRNEWTQTGTTKGFA